MTMLSISCKAQSPIFGYEEIPNVIPQNAYIRDTNNILNKFAGTWVFSENGQNFKVTLQKAEMVNILNEYFKDMIFGQYIYTVDNTVIVNTSNYNGKASKIRGLRLITNDNKIKVVFNDPERSKMASIVELTYSNTAGIEKLHWRLYMEAAQHSMVDDPPAQFDFRVPTNCDLIKQ